MIKTLIALSIALASLGIAPHQQAVCTTHSTQAECLPGLVAQDTTAAFFPLAQQYVTWQRAGEGYVHSDLHLY